MPTTRHGARNWLDQQEKTDRKNARIIDKIVLALPRELQPGRRRMLVQAFAEQLTLGKASWLAALHQVGADQHNSHAHLVIRDRDPESGKRVAKLSDKGAVDRVRLLWEEACNTALEAAGEAARIDRRSYAAQGVQNAPQRHRGPYQWRNLPYGQFADAARHPWRLAVVAHQRDQLVRPLPVDDQIVLGQRLALGNLANVAGEVAQRTGGAGTLAQGVHAEGNGGPVGFVGHGFTGEAVQPALDAARQVEIVRVDGQNLAAAQDRVVQPRRQLDLPWFGRIRVTVMAVRRHVRKAVAFRDAVARQPRKRLFLPGFVVMPDVGDDGGDPQASDRLGQFLIMPPACTAPHLAQGIVRSELNTWGSLAALFNRIVEMRGSKDQKIPVPDGRDTKLSRRMNSYTDIFATKLDRLHAAFLQGQEWELHDIAVVTERRLESAHSKHVELGNSHFQNRISARDTTIAG